MSEKNFRDEQFCPKCNKNVKPRHSYQSFVIDFYCPECNELLSEKDVS